MSDISECPFCQLDSQIIKSNQSAMLFLSNPRKTFGHILVCPKRHIEKPWELTKAEILDIYDLIFYAEDILINTIADGIDIKQNYRPFLKQSRLKVDHVHYHVLPRSNKDSIYRTPEKDDKILWQDLTDDEARQIKNLLLN